MYYKFLNGDKSPVSGVLKELGFKEDSFTYKINEVNICDNFDENMLHGGGFYFADEKNILNFLGYGMTVYDVIIPEDAKIIKFTDEVDEIKSDKIILTNPRKVDKAFVEKMFNEGAVISDDKIVGVIHDLITQKEYDLAKIIFEKIDFNNEKLLDEITRLNIPSELLDTYKQVYSKATSPEVITYLYNIASYQNLYHHNKYSIENLVLSNIAKNVDKPIKEIINEYIKNEEIVK